ncbi:MAG: hypothetical protein HOK57_10095 [Planctomycetaceae bacterium]|nr:hypothetical protein [Bacteroidetes Order II. bacterium]MBT6460163.1 hypothetical protein [Planctomycetaceae bacterium]
MIYTFIFETCAAACINGFFLWPKQPWELGEWVEGFTTKVEQQMTIQPYANYEQNLIVEVRKTKTVNGCAAVRIEVRAVNPDLPTAVKTSAILEIEKVCLND